MGQSSILVFESQTFPLNVKYKNIDILVKTCSCHVNTNDLTSKNFPLQKKGTLQLEVEAFLVHHSMNKEITTGKILEEIDKIGYRPADIWELLAFEAAYPQQQRKYQILELSSSWGEDDEVGSLGEYYAGKNSYGRLISLWSKKFTWSKYPHFLVFKK